jgi:GT2 family glycosyltransferase
MNITLVIPTYRNPKYLDMCLQSATENRDNSDTQILTILDGYVDESKPILDKYPNTQYLELEQNKGMSYALNVGVMQAETELVFIVNDDNVLPRHWDTRIVSAFKSTDKYTNIGHVLTVDQVEPTGPSMFNFPVMDLGQTVETFNYKAWLDYEEASAMDLTKTDGHIFPFVMQKKHYLAMGGFDTFFNSPNVVDWDWFMRLELMGFSFPRTRKVRLYHFGSVATKKNAESQQFRNREAQAFAEYQFKWGAMPYNKPNSNEKIPVDKAFRGFKA